MRHSALANLHGAVAAVCPIGGVSIGDLNDRSTWRIDFSPDATAPQKAAAQNVLDTFDINAPTSEDVRVKTLNDDAQVIDLIAKLKTMSAAEVDTFFTNNVITAAQAIGVLKAVVKVLAYKLR